MKGHPVPGGRPLRGPVLAVDDSTIVDTLVRSGEQRCTLELLGGRFQGRTATGIKHAQRLPGAGQGAPGHLRAHLRQGGAEGLPAPEEARPHQLDGEKYSIRTQKQGPEYLLVDGYNVIFAWEELERLVDLNVVCTVSSVDTGLALNAVAENRSTVAEAHSPGGHRSGLWGISHLRAGEDPAGLSLFAQRGSVRHLHPAPRRHRQEPGVDGQLGQFQQVLEAIHQAGFETGTVHAAGSFA